MANLIPFTKRFESSENLVGLLESRGLQIGDRNKVIQYLDNIGYYRLSAYMYPLLKMQKTAHLYKNDATFKQVMMLYRFDKKLRRLMFNEIEKIEIAVRRAVMQIPADMIGTPFWFTGYSNFLDNSKFNETMRAISKEYSKSKEEFIQHYKRTYQPAIPNSPVGAWMTLPTDSMRAYFDLCIIKYSLNVVSPNNDMQSKLTWLFIRFPEIDLKTLGFPQGWEMEPLWR